MPALQKFDRWGKRETQEDRKCHRHQHLPAGIDAANNDDDE
jgi:hypothetical protein